jgi:hypothetical protein
VTRLLLAAAVAAIVPSAGALEPEHLPPGPPPGKVAHGRFPDSVRDVRVLVSAGHGYARIRLLIARGRQDQLCVSAIAGRQRRARFQCMAGWDRPPLIARVGVGGRSRARPDWLSVVGLVRLEVDSVTVESERIASSKLRLRGFPGFPWRAFTVRPARGQAQAESVRALDTAGGVMQRIDTSWAYRSPCMRKRKECTASERRGRWSGARDPYGDAEAGFVRRAGGSRAKRLATDHPIVRQLIAAQPFSMGSVALWTRCNGRRIGAVVPLRLSRPVDFEGDVPVYGNSIDTAYLEGTAHMRFGGVVFFRVYVDLNRSKVVGIIPEDDTLDGRAGGRPRPTFDIKIVGEMRPAGGPDQGKPCETKPGA